MKKYTLSAANDSRSEVFAEFENYAQAMSWMVKSAVFLPPKVRLIIAEDGRPIYYWDRAKKTAMAYL